MKIVIEMEYWTSSGDVGQRRASFGVDDLEFAIKPDLEAVRVAYQWFDHVRREYPYDIKIKSVKYNQEHDITAGLQAVLEKEARVANEDWRAPWE